MQPMRHSTLIGVLKAIQMTVKELIMELIQVSLTVLERVNLLRVRHLLVLRQVI